MRKLIAVLAIALLASVMSVVVPAGLPAKAAPASIVMPMRFPVLGGASFVDTFGAPRSGGRTHQGQDLFAPKLRTLVATTDATVVRMSTASAGLSGNYVVIEDAAGWEYVYIHVNNDTPGTDDGANRRLEAFVPGIYPGAKVYAGQPLGYLGDSGNAETTPPHLHFEIRDPSGTPINAFDSLRAASREPIDPNVYAGGMSAGTWDATNIVPGGFRTSGWAHDPDGATGSVEVYDNGQLAGVISTGQSRPDVAAIRGPSAASSGFSGSVGAGPGSHSICLWARNVGRGPASYLGCGSIFIESLPFGNLDTVSVDALAGTATVAGWSLDLQTDASTEIDVYVNGRFAGWGYASRSRPDLLGYFPFHSPNHGFSVTVPVPVGTSSVCAYAIDDARSDRARWLGCQASVRSGAPFGTIDSATRVPGGAQLLGWGIDADWPGAIAVHAYSGGQLVGYGWADQSRPDVGAVYPPYGANHGYVLNLALASGLRTVCLYGIDAQGGANPSLGCRTVDVSPVPLGNVDGLARSGDTVSINGWAFDPDVNGAAEVHVLVDGVFAGWAYASQIRDDIGAAFPAYGAGHGFSLAVPVSPGSHDVCTYAINAGAGSANRFLGCQRV